MHHRSPCRPPLCLPCSGYLSLLPLALTGLHWFVHSLATPMNYTLEMPGGVAERGAGLAHWEKNWGVEFPSSWHWAQGINATTANDATSSGGRDRGTTTNSSSSGVSGGGGGTPPQPEFQAAFVLASGPPPVPLPPSGWLPRVWLLGVRTPGYRWVQGSEEEVGGRTVVLLWWCSPGLCRQRKESRHLLGSFTAWPQPSLRQYFKRLLQLVLPSMGLHFHGAGRPLPRLAAAHRRPAAGAAGGGGAGAPTGWVRCQSSLQAVLTLTCPC